METAGKMVCLDDTEIFLVGMGDVPLTRDMLWFEMYLLKA